MIEILKLSDDFMEFRNDYGVKLYATKERDLWQIFVSESGSKLPDSKKYTDYEYFESFRVGDLKELIDTFVKPDINEYEVGRTVLVGTLNHNRIA